MNFIKTHLEKIIIAIMLIAFISLANSWRNNYIEADAKYKDSNVPNYFPILAATMNTLDPSRLLSSLTIDFPVVVDKAAKQCMDIENNSSKLIDDASNEIVVNGTLTTINDYFYNVMPKILNDGYTKFESDKLNKLPADVKLANISKSFSPVSAYFISEFQPTIDPLDFIYTFHDVAHLMKAKNRYVYFKGSWYVENDYKKVVSKQDAIKELNVLIRSFNSYYEDKKIKEGSWKDNNDSKKLGEKNDY